MMTTLIENLPWAPIVLGHSRRACDPRDLRRRVRLAAVPPDGRARGALPRARADATSTCPPCRLKSRCSRSAAATTWRRSASGWANSSSRPRSAPTSKRSRAPSAAKTPTAWSRSSASPKAKPSSSRCCTATVSARPNPSARSPEASRSTGTARAVRPPRFAARCDSDRINRNPNRVDTPTAAPGQ